MGLDKDNVTITFYTMSSHSISIITDYCKNIKSYRKGHFENVLLIYADKDTKSKDTQPKTKTKPTKNTNPNQVYV
jgi:hypothetical protein